MVMDNPDGNKMQWQIIATKIDAAEETAAEMR
jgi:hypothetical protein